jgi:ribosomal protein S27AE
MNKPTNDNDKCPECGGNLVDHDNGKTSECKDCGYTETETT